MSAVNASRSVSNLGDILFRAGVLPGGSLEYPCFHPFIAVRVARQRRGRHLCHDEFRFSRWKAIEGIDVRECAKVAECVISHSGDVSG